ncbi:MAG: 1-acyl-sn-glycerol-3-phosphate acyltransferase [Pseudomonadota bacterium]
MRDKIDPLIEERAPWLFGTSKVAKPARRMLNRVLGYDRTVALAEHFRDMDVRDIMDQLSGLLAQDVKVKGLENVPLTGPALVVANHPTGIADGIMLWHALARRRPDLFIYANSDIMRILPQFSEIIAPVEWQDHKRSHAKTRETMAFTRAAIDHARLGVIFPSGRLAKRRGLWLFERPWMASAAMIAKKFDLPVIPIKVQARNSALFYLFDLIHPTLRDITLFHETLNKGRQPYRISIGKPIHPASLPARSDDGIKVLRRATLRMGGRNAQGVSLVSSSRKPRWARGLLPET